MATNNEHVNVSPKVAEDFKEALKKLDGKDLVTRVRILLGKDSKTLDKLKDDGPDDTYRLLLENMAMICALYGNLK